MAALPIEDRRPLWDRPTLVGALVSAAAPLAAVIIGNALVALTGAEENPDYAAVSWNPPGWLIGAIWLVIYPLWGLARWKTATSGGLASRSWWLVALMAWGLAYPVVVAFTDTTGSVIANGASFVLTLAAFIRVWPASKTAAALIAPSLLWLVIANTLGWAALQNAG